MQYNILLTIAALASTTLASPVAAAAATTTSTGNQPLASQSHHGPDAVYDVEIIYRNANNIQCNGENYKVATIRQANAGDGNPVGCVTFDNPAMAFQIGARPESQQIGMNAQGIGCQIDFYSDTNCGGATFVNSVGYIPSSPAGTASMTTYGTCYKSKVLARSANILCGP